MLFTIEVNVYRINERLDNIIPTVEGVMTLNRSVPVDLGFCYM